MNFTPFAVVSTERTESFEDLKTMFSNGYAISSCDVSLPRTLLKSFVIYSADTILPFSNFWFAIASLPSPCEAAVSLNMMEVYGFVTIRFLVIVPLDFTAPFSIFCQSICNLVFPLAIADMKQYLPDCSSI